MKTFVGLSAGALFGFSAGAAMAADLQMVMEPPVVEQAVSEWGQFYLEVYGGWHLDGTETDSVAGDLSVESGAAFGASLGLLTPVPGLALELDLMQTKAEYTGFPGSAIEDTSLMAKVEYSIPVNDVFDVYGAAGLGLVHRIYNQVTFPVGTSEGTGLGYQVAIGARAKVTEDVAVFAELKHQDTFEEIEMTGIVASGSQYSTTSALVGVRFSF